MVQTQELVSTIIILRVSQNGEILHRLSDSQFHKNESFVRVGQGRQPFYDYTL
jgi:hypothetical protein